MVKLFQFFFLVSLFSCDYMIPKQATEEQKKQAIKEGKFEQEIINNLDTYKKIKSFLLKNLDTLIAIRHSKNKVIVVGAGGSQDSTYLSDDDCYSFIDENPQQAPENFPVFLKDSFEAILRLLGNHGIELFEICKNKKIVITVKEERKGNGLYLYHNLMWNVKK